MVVHIGDETKWFAFPSHTNFVRCMFYYAVNRRLDEWVQVDAMDLNTVETENDDNKDDKVGTASLIRHTDRNLLWVGCSCKDVLEFLVDDLGGESLH